MKFVCAICYMDRKDEDILDPWRLQNHKNTDYMWQKSLGTSPTQLALSLNQLAPPLNLDLAHVQNDRSVRRIGRSSTPSLKRPSDSVLTRTVFVVNRSASLVTVAIL